MTNQELENVLQWAAQAPYEMDEAPVRRAADAILPSLRPVRRVSSARVIALVLGFIFIATAILGATYLGFSHVLSGPQSQLIFFAIAVLARLSTTATAAAMVPGSKGWVEPRMLLASGTFGCVAIFAVLFHDYRLDRFASEGIECLGNGLLYAAVAGLLLWLVLRRGFILDPPTAGLAAGTLAGIAGLATLELHCPILKAMHLMVWHTAVVPLSGLAGYLAGRLVQDFGTKRRAAEFMQ